MMGAAGAGGEGTYVDDVFSAYLFNGNSGTQTITNGINFAEEGGMVWCKSRTSGHHEIADTERGTATGNNGGRILRANDTSVQSMGDVGHGFTSSGFTLGFVSGDINWSPRSGISWSFRKQKGFFDVVTYTGNATNRLISHSLGSVPGMIMVKCLNSNEEWRVYHRDLGATKTLRLDATTAVANEGNVCWNNTEPTATTFSLGTHALTNGNGNTYVAYIFGGGDATNIDITSKTLTNLGDSFSSSYSMSYINDGVAETSNATSMGSVPSGGQFDIYVDLTSPHVVTKYRIAPQGGGNTTYNLPVKFEVYGTNDTSSWNFITTCQTTYNGWFAGDYRDFPLPGLNSYRYWRIKVLEGRDSSGNATTAKSISEWKLEGFSPSLALDTPEYKFGGDGDKNIIDTGSYTGTGSSDGPVIDLGWEPQWVIIKGVGTVNWAVFDHLRGVASKTHSSTGGDNYIHPDENSGETANLERIEFTPTGFKIRDGGWINTAGDKHIYMAIRRSDGNVGKPVEVGTDVFSLSPGNGSSTIPNFTTNHVVDFATYRQPASTHHWEQTARLMGTGYVYLNRDLAANHWSNLVFDSMTGFQNHSGHGSDYQAWAWKRHAGFDVQVYDGLGALSAPRVFGHNLGRPPEMIWVKNCSSAYNWRVWHKDLNNGGASAAPYNLLLDTNAAQSANGDIFGGSGNVLPTATQWTTGGNASVNENGSKHLSVLFASVAGISKCGGYTGTGASHTITTGFSPRFLLIKNISYVGGENWRILDTRRGWGAGNDEQIRLSSNSPQSAGDWGTPTSTGFTLTASADTAYNKSGDKYIYYAHA
jgi:hypothetical protein